MRAYKTLLVVCAAAVGGASCVGVLFFPFRADAAALTVMQSEPPRSMDPGDQNASFTSAILDPIYEGLLTRSETGDPIPELATEWQRNETGLLWTFKLRKGVVFHDGTPFNADAVVKNFARHLDKARGLASSGHIRMVLEKVEALDDLTVRFTMKRRYPGFLVLLTTASAWMVSPAADKAGTIGAKAVGTGPYRLVEHRSGEYVLEERNPDYWGTPPSLDRIKWTWTSEPSVMSMAIQTGDADIVNPLPPAFASRLASNKSVEVTSSDGAGVFWVALNTTMKPLDDVRVRRALNFATDRAGLVRAVMYGYATPAGSPLAPVATGYDESVAPYPLDLDKARTLLAEAGYPKGFGMSVAVQEPEARIAEMLQAMWAKIGVKLEIKRMESGVWTRAAFADPAGKEADNIGSVIASWSSINDPDFQLRPLYHSAAAAPANANLGFFSSSKVDALLDDALETLDEAERRALYVEAQREISEQAPHVLLYTSQDVYAARKGVAGVGMIPGGQLVVERAAKK